MNERSSGRKSRPKTASKGHDACYLRVGVLGRLGRGERRRARLACSYRLAGAMARLQNANRCSLRQLCCSKFASTLNC